MQDEMENKIRTSKLKLVFAAMIISIFCIGMGVTVYAADTHVDSVNVTGMGNKFTSVPAGETIDVVEYSDTSCTIHGMQADVDKRYVVDEKTVVTLNGKATKFTKKESEPGVPDLVYYTFTVDTSSDKKEEDKKQEEEKKEEKQEEKKEEQKEEKKEEQKKDNKQDDKKESNDGHSSDHSEKSSWEKNPNEMSIGGFSGGTGFSGAVNLGKQEQGPLGKLAFAQSRPAGWNEAFSFNMTVNGKADHSPKNGTLKISIPAQYIKSGRQFAVQAIEGDGTVKLYNDIDNSDSNVTIAVNGTAYAFDLIYIG
jgi:hypothetical protein